MTPSHLVLVFFSTAGQNGENLGSDEAQIVLFVYLLYDVGNNKVVALHKQYVRPSWEDGVLGENILTEECRIQTGLDENAIRSAHPLEQVLDEFDRFITAKEVHPDNSGRPFTFLCDGQLHFRMCLHPEIIRKNMFIPQYFNKFYDLRREFKKMYKLEVVNCIKDMLDYLSLEPSDQTVDYGVHHVQEMANILQRLLTDGHEFGDPERVKDKLEPGICKKDDQVDDETVIRARGLPWQSSDQDIARFFRGLNVAKGGVALCLSQQGRRNGEALIRFDCKEHRDLALRKHKHHLGQRYIEVYRASGKDFIDVAGGNNAEAVKFLQRHGDNGEQVIVRMRGLPYSCTTEQVLDFFRGGDDGCDVLDAGDGVLFVHQADGRATGDAFVLFANEDEAAKALSKHRHVIGSRYIELFKSTTAEVQQVLNRSMDPRAQHPENANSSQNESQIALIPQIPSQSQALLGMQPSVPGGVLLPQQLITCGTTKDCIRLRGLPFEATVTDILTFLGEHARNIVFQGVHMVYTAQGTPSGEAFIQMENEQSADVAAMAKHKKYLLINGKKRFIEVFQCSGEDMNLVLTHGLLPNSGTMPTTCSPTSGQLNGMHNGLSTNFPTNNSSQVAQQQTVQVPTLPLLTPGISGSQVLATKPLVSPGGTLLSGGVQGISQPPVGGILPLHGNNHVSVVSQNSMSNNSHMVVPSGALGTNPLSGPFFAGHTNVGLSSGVVTQVQGSARTIPGPYGLQPMLYWYPSPPVSPQSAYYVHSGPTSVVMKGLPFNTSPQDILGYFDGIYEVQPDIQIQRTSDGRFTGEAVITFGSRGDAERAVAERNKKILHNHYIDVHMA